MKLVQYYRVNDEMNAGNAYAGTFEPMSRWAREFFKFPLLELVYSDDEAEEQKTA